MPVEESKDYEDTMRRCVDASSHSNWQQIKGYILSSFDQYLATKTLLFDRNSPKLELYSLKYYFKIQSLNEEIFSLDL